MVRIALAIWSKNAISRFPMPRMTTIPGNRHTYYGNCERRAPPGVHLTGGGATQGFSGRSESTHRIRLDSGGIYRFSHRTTAGPLAGREPGFHGAGPLFFSAETFQRADQILTNSSAYVCWARGAALAVAQQAAFAIPVLGTGRALNHRTTFTIHRLESGYVVCGPAHFRSPNPQRWSLGLSAFNLTNIFSVLAAPTPRSLQRIAPDASEQSAANSARSGTALDPLIMQFA